MLKRRNKFDVQFDKIIDYYSVFLCSTAVVWIISGITVITFFLQQPQPDIALFLLSIVLLVVIPYSLVCLFEWLFNVMRNYYRSKKDTYDRLCANTAGLLKKLKIINNTYSVTVFLRDL